MLHMVVQTHTAESCPFRSEENRTAMGEALNLAVRAYNPGTSPRLPRCAPYDPEGHFS